MSESDDAPECASEATRAGQPPVVAVEAYREGDDVAALVTVGCAAVVLGYAESLTDRLESDRVVPDRYVDIAPDTPAWYPGAMRESGARVSDAADLRARADGLYADGFAVAPGVGVVPCNPPHTVVVRVLGRGPPVDLLLSNADEDAAEAGSLSGALPLYGAVDTADGRLTGEHPGEGVLRAVGSAWLLDATGAGDRARTAGIDVGVVPVPADARRVDVRVGPRGDVESACRD
jgi:hypothetical protein